MRLTAATYDKTRAPFFASVCRGQHCCYRNPAAWFFAAASLGERPFSCRIAAAGADPDNNLRALPTSPEHRRFGIAARCVRPSCALSRLQLSWGRHPFWLGVYLFGYLGLAGLYFCLWLLGPEAAFAGFLLLTVFHWGEGDVRFAELFLGRSRLSRWGEGLTLALRGGLPIVLPVLTFPETAESLFRYAARGLGLEPTALDLTSSWFAVPLAAGFGLAVVGYVFYAVRAAPNAAVLSVDLFELGLLAALFSLVPAYLAIGVYFTLWHSPRHLARLLLLDANVARKPLPKRIRRLAWDVLPLTLVALALLGGLYFVSAARVTTLEGFVALYLVLISSLTLPHTVVVALLDVWQPAPNK